MSTVASNGLAGIQINPRWATRIYYNCDTPDCTTAEWIATSAGSGDFYALLAAEKADTMRHFFGLRRDPYMFHQANLRNIGVPSVTINGVTAQLSLFQSWAETMVQEFVRLVNWPLISQTHGDVSITQRTPFSLLFPNSLADVRILCSTCCPRCLWILDFLER
jgi:hypothetical protein